MNAPHTVWLRRLSDYHSGGISDAERAAVESHLRDCSDCQEALAMYRRFYALAHSPLRLGAPSYSLQQGGDPTRPAVASSSATSAPTWPPAGAPPRAPRPRRRLLAGAAAVAAVALVVAGFIAALSTRGAAPVASTPSPRPANTVTTAPSPTVASATATPASSVAPNPSSFVCANPAGSSLVYAYENQSGAVFTVTGCAAPKQLFAGAGFAVPVAWSPSNRYLAVDMEPAIGNALTVDTIFILDAHGSSSIRTKYGLYFGPTATAGKTFRIFIGWLDDSTFLGAVVPINAGGQTGVATGPASIVRVDVATQAETKVGTVTWFADAKVRGGGKYLFYGGYQSASEGQGYLHRLDLTTGQDTQLVPLGFAGQAGCQGSPICNWTAPWDASADGLQVVFHSPGPTKPWTDTYQPPDSPLYLRNLSGASPVNPIVSKLATSLTTPVYSPDDGNVATVGASYDPSNPYSHPQTGLTPFGGPTAVVDGGFVSWRADSHAVVLMYTNGPLLYDLSTRATTPLQSGTSGYLWGN